MSRAPIHALAAAATAGACLAVAHPIADVSALAVAMGALALALPLASGIGRQGLTVVAVGALAAAHAASARDATLAPPLGLWFAARHAVPHDVARPRAAPPDAALAASNDAAPRASSRLDPDAAWRATPSDRRRTARAATTYATIAARSLYLDERAHAAPETDDAAPVVLRGVLEADAARTDSGAIRLRVAVREVRRTAIAAHEEWTRTSGSVLLHVQGERGQAVFGEWTRGRPIATTATLRWPPVLQNPGGAAPLVQRLRRGYVLTGTVKSAALVDVSPGPWWHEAAARMRRHVRRTLADTFGHARPLTAAIVTAILIGDRDGLDRNVTERLIAAGTYHVIAISGGNVALVTLVVVVVLRHLTRSARGAALAALATVAMYGWIVGPEPSVQRAVTAACIWLAAEGVGIRAPPGRIFSLVALVIIAFDPLIVVLPGAWLSFGATLGILTFASRMMARVTERQAAVPQRPAWRAAAVAAGLAVATIAAEAALLPVSAWAFSRVSVAGVLLNFVAIPAMSAVQIAGVAVVAAADLWPSAARLAAALAHVSVVALTDSARLVDWAPALSWRVPPPHGVVVGAYYVALTVLATGSTSRTTRRVSLGVVAALAWVIANPPHALHRGPPRGTLRLTVLDVGQGDAIVVQFPSGQTLVVDAGPAGDAFDTGERVVTPALWALGVRQVDWAAFSHADGDHIGGLASVVSQFGAREIWEGVPVPDDGRREYLRLVSAEHDAAWRSLRQGDRWEAGGAELVVIHPPEPDWRRVQVRNDDSLVFRVRYGRFEALLTGDIGRDVERSLDPHVAPDQLRILKVAHHGSRTSSSDDLLRRYRPWAAIVSAGRNNPFGHPAPDVTERLADAGVMTLRTDRDGAVSIESDGASVVMKTWAGRRWRVVMGPGP